MEPGEIYTRSLAAIAVGCYLLRVLGDVWDFSSPRIARMNRWAWTVGCFSLWLHIAAAFHFIHDWSHSDAGRQTAEQTREITGWAFGGGVYFNYAFAVIWLGDVVRWWRKGLDEPSESPVWFWAIHAVFAFMILNATVVFGPHYWRYVGVIYAGLLVCIWMIQRRSGNRK